MNNSLDNFVRAAMHEHDGIDCSDLPTVALPKPAQVVDNSELPTVVETKSSGAVELGILPGHAVEDFIARGGMGAVYRARQMALEREVAVKVMTSAAESAEMALRFRREALVLGKLEHPNIVPIYDLGTDDGGQIYYTMKLVKGRTLQAIINALRNQEPETMQHYSLASLLTIFRKVCDALAFAHSQGILHRDLKPENIMVGEFGEVLVMDWGLAKRMNDAGGSMKPDAIADDDADSSFILHASSFQGTLQGSVMGTPQYMSPEQALGQIDELDECSDIFSLGGILYAILTLRPPVEGQTLDEVLHKVRTAEITSPSAMPAGTTAKGNAKAKSDVLEAKLIKPLPHVPSGRVPAALSSVVMKALRLDKAQRYQNVSALSADIEAYQGGFATSAEEAGAWKQLKLLMLRHKAATAALAAMVLLSAAFMVKVMASERKATRNAEIAMVNEQRANENAEQTRRALKTSQIAVAEAALRSADLPAMVEALDSVPADLRDQRWEYLSAKRSSSRGMLRFPGFMDVRAMKVIPGRPARFFLANAEGTLGLVDIRFGTMPHQFPTSFRGNLVLGISADGISMAVSAEGASQVQIFGLISGRLEKTISSPSSSLKKLIWSPDGKRLLLTHSEGGSLMDLQDGSIRWEVKQSIADAVFSPDGGRVFTIGGANLRALTVHSAETGEPISKIPGFMESMAMSRDGTKLAVGLFDGEVMIVDVATGKEIRRVRLLLGSVSRMAWTKGDHLLTIGSAGGIERGRQVMQLWETKNFSLAGTFFGLQNDYADLKFEFDPSTGYLLLGEKLPQLWRIPADLELASYNSISSEQGWSICFLNDRTVLGRNDYALARFEISPLGRLKLLPPPGPVSSTMAVAHWGSETVAMASRIGAPPYDIKIFSTAGGELKEKRSIPAPSLVTRLDFDPSGQRLLAIFAKGEASVFEVATGKALLNLPVRPERAVFAGSGDFIAAIVAKKRQANDVEDELTLFNSKTGEVVKKQSYHHRLTELAVSADRKLLAIGGMEQVIRMLDADTLEERANFRAHDREITALTFHPFAPILVSGSSDGSVKFWDYTTTTMLSSYIGLDDMPIMIAFSPDARFMGVEAQGRTWNVFDLKRELVPGSASKIYQPKPRPPVPPGPDGWQDLIAALTDFELADEGGGWVRNGDSMVSKNIGTGLLRLPGVATGMSYRLHLTVRQVSPKDMLNVMLPVGDRLVGFELDRPIANVPNTGLATVDGKWGQSLPGTLQGKQIKDAEPHNLDFEVRLRGADATITVTLDQRPLFEWTGPQQALDVLPFWRATPGRLALGTAAPGWMIHEAMLKPLE